MKAPGFKVNLKKRDVSECKKVITKWQVVDHVPITTLRNDLGFKKIGTSLMLSNREIVNYFLRVVMIN